MAACALAGFDAAAVVPVLPHIEALLDAGPMIPRRCAVKALAASGRSEAGGRLAQALQEKDAQLRRWVIEGLRRLDVAAQYQQLLVGTARNDPDPATRALALRSLAGSLDATAESAWRTGTADPAPRVRAAAVHELVRAGLADVIASALQDPAWEVRVAALIGLTRRPAVADGRG
jgi:HEAT repeat protein